MYAIKTQNHSGWPSRGTAKNTGHFLWHPRMEGIPPVNGGIGENVTELDVGVAVGKIGDKTYAVVVMMPTKTAAAPGTPDKD